MMMRRVASAVLVLATLGLALPAAAAPPADSCKAPDELTGAVASLPRVAAVLKPGGTLRVLGIGSATMFGPEASLRPGTVTSQALNGGTRPDAGQSQTLNHEPSETAFPKQMAKALQAMVPGLTVQVVVRGGRGMSAGELLGVMKKELETGGPYQLVLWQTGTVEAVRNAPPGEFAAALAQGAEAVEAAGANLVLIDSQYSRFLQTNSNLDPYTQALQQVASMPGVLLFHRFDLMRNWASEGQIDLERAPKADRKRMVEVLHMCLGQHLARMVLAGARS
jgi:acyl-CoA thioesterase I